VEILPENTERPCTGHVVRFEPVEMPWGELPVGIHSGGFQFRKLSLSRQRETAEPLIPKEQSAPTSLTAPVLTTGFHPSIRLLLFSAPLTLVPLMFRP